MTREQILAMPAGREMDALVATRIFGWTDITGPSYLTSAIDGITGICPDPRGGNCWGRRCLPNFSTEIDAAWSVQAHLAEDERLRHLYCVTLSGMVWTLNGQPHLRGWQDWNDTWSLLNATPEMRCRAALIAVYVAED